MPQPSLTGRRFWCLLRTGLQGHHRWHRRVYTSCLLLCIIPQIALFCKVFLKSRLILYAATPRQLRFDLPRAPEFQQLRNFRRRCSFCPYFLQLNSQKCPYFQLFGNEMDQIPQLICSLPFAFPVWKKHPKCAIIKAKKFVQSGDTHVNNPRLKSRACSGKSVL